MTPQQQQARERAVTSLKELMRTYVPDMGEESRDQVRAGIEAAVDTLIADLATPPVRPEYWTCACGVHFAETVSQCPACGHVRPVFSDPARVLPTVRDLQEAHRQAERTDGSER